MISHKLIHSFALLGLAAGVSSGCQGVLRNAASDDPSSGSDVGSVLDRVGVGEPSQGACEVPPTQVRMLNNEQYDNTVRDLLGTSQAFGEGFPGEPIVGGFNNNADALAASAQLVEDYAAAAEALSAEAVERLVSLVNCEGEDAECGTAFIQDFGRRAFRRPLSELEVARYQRTFEAGAEFDFSSGIEFVINAMLQSRSFLYNTENVIHDGRIEPYALASKLSYFLWNSMPDDELLEAAGSGQLIYNPGELSRQVERMLNDQRSRNALRDFVSQWLHFQDFDAVSKSTDTYPEYTPELDDLWKEQLLLFAEEAILSGDGLDELMTGKYTFVNDELAALYGFPEPGSDELTRVELPAGRPGGLLGQPGLMAIHHRGLPSIHRGQFVLSQFMCGGLPPPPDNLEIPTVEDENLTLREYTDELTLQGGCAGCHSVMNPFGHALGEFDGMGRVDMMDSRGFEVDSLVELPFETESESGSVSMSVNGAEDLATRMLDSIELRRCFVRHWYRYAASRLETKADACSLHNLITGFDGDVRALLLSIVTDDTFTRGVTP